MGPGEPHDLQQAEVQALAAEKRQPGIIPGWRWKI